MVLWIVPMGVFAGVLTTLAGLGGGMLLLLGLSLVLGPREALAATAPALMVSNLHRAYLYRGDIDRGVVTPVLLGVLPGSVAGAVLLPAIPSGAVQGMMAAMTALACARAVKGVKWTPPAGMLGPAGFAIGALCATSGGAGLLIAPLLMTAGLSGERYIASGAAVGAVMHLGRVVGYGSVGLLTPETLRIAAVLTVSLLVGTTLGARVRTLMPAGVSRSIELGALGVATALALAGVR